MTPTRYVVIITGSRKWTDAYTISARLACYPPGTIVFHGDAPGADTIAASLCPAFGHVPIAHPYFSHLGRAGGHARNALLADLGAVYRRHGYAVVVEAFPLPDSRGTPNMCLRAEGNGLFLNVERKYVGKGWHWC